jgi:DNA-directed RNA polymerase subunit RPC12/RpoP
MNTFLEIIMSNQTCSHCGKEVPDTKTFCTYCGYRIQKKSRDAASDKDQSSKTNKKSEKGSNVFIIAVVAMILILLLGVIIPRYLQEDELISDDLDKDGIQNSEDDYPKDYRYSVKLKVLDSNLYQLGDSYQVVMKFENPRAFYVSDIEIFMTLKTAEGAVAGQENTTFWSGNILSPYSTGLSFWYFSTLLQDVDSYEITIKGAKHVEQNPLQPSNITLLSHKGNKTNGTGILEPKYVVNGTVINMGSSEELVNIWIEFRDENGKLLDVNFESEFVSPDMDSTEFKVHSFFPEADKIKNYQVTLVVELS